jgi:predicted negative regulator of RcsB-dependent stress response
LVVVARAHLANGLPSAAITSYRKILDGCPDELFAREAGRAVLRMYLYADQLDAAIEQAAALRERFTDNDFKAFSYLMEGAAQERKGDEGAAIQAFKASLAAKGLSPSGAQANERLSDLKQDFWEDMKKLGLQLD